ncbi:MAG: FAD/NAD(P)-binding protein [Gammaproteobacteria bacterium]|nr:FAD/NAD(P)-binding protein [Gammaproteobacteria bacterium]
MSREASLHLPQRGGRAARAPHYDVVIIGGGYAGVVAAIHLLRRASPPRLAIIEPSVRLGRGVAYGTRLSCHLLNTRAKHMSLRNDDDQHYTRWAQARAQARGGAAGVDESSFTPTWLVRRLRMPGAERRRQSSWRRVHPSSVLRDVLRASRARPVEHRAIRWPLPLRAAGDTGGGQHAASHGRLPRLAFAGRAGAARLGFTEPAAASRRRCADRRHGSFDGRRVVNP